MGGFKAIADTIDPVLKVRSMRSLLALHRFDANQPTNSLAQIYKRHYGYPTLRKKVLHQNTFLMNQKLEFLGPLAAGLGWVYLGPAGAFFYYAGKAAAQKVQESTVKPAAEHRALAYGQYIRNNNYDLALLQEVWKTDDLNDFLLKAWHDDAHKPNVASMVSPLLVFSSGLVTISKNWVSEDTRFYEYKAQAGEDVLARKGVMLTRYDVGFGPSKLEVYNTHLNAGDSAAIYQIRELFEWYKSVHNSKNVAIITGDFNMEQFANLGGDTGEYIEVVNAIRDNHFTDLWLTRALRPEGGVPYFGHTCNMDKFHADIDGDGSIESVADRVCKPFGGNPNARYCEDTNTFTRKIFSADGNIQEVTEPLWPSFTGSNRIDYIFVQNPMVEHSFNVDFTRPRRLRQPRNPSDPEYDKLQFLSDHLGLEFEMILSPK